MPVRGGRLALAVACQTLRLRDPPATLRLAVLESQKLSIGGAYLLQAISLRHPDQMAVLAEKLGATPAGEMARAHVERLLYGQQFKQQSPR